MLTISITAGVLFLNPRILNLPKKISSAAIDHDEDEARFYYNRAMARLKLGQTRRSGGFRTL